MEIEWSLARFGEYCVFERRGLPVEGLGDGLSGKGKARDRLAHRLAVRPGRDLRR